MPWASGRKRRCGGARINPLPHRQPAVARRCVVRDATHRPLSVRALAQPLRACRAIASRQGTAEKLCGRFARVRVIAAHDDQARSPEWLVIKWPRGDAEPLRYWASTLPEATTFTARVNTIKGRWLIERDYLASTLDFADRHADKR